MYSMNTALCLWCGRVSYGAACAAHAVAGEVEEKSRVGTATETGEGGEERETRRA